MWEYNTNYLCHHGIPGMKWGIRRWQNEDGSYTKAGQKRYGMNLDLNDKSRVNIAKIRLGESRRRYDVAKRNNETNTYRLAELKGRERSAKRMVKRMKKVDKGAKLESKGQTILGNKVRVGYAAVAAYMATESMRLFLNKRLKDLGAEGRYTPKHAEVAKMIHTASLLGAGALVAAYNAKKSRDNAAIRSYYNSKWGGESTIKKVGSEEYKDVIERNTKKSSSKSFNESSPSVRNQIKESNKIGHAPSMEDERKRQKQYNF